MKRILALSLALLTAALSMTACARRGKMPVDQTAAFSETTQPAQTETIPETDTTTEPDMTTATQTDAPHSSTVVPPTAAEMPFVPPAAAQQPGKADDEESRTENETGALSYPFTVNAFRTGSCRDSHSFPRGTVADSTAALDAFFANNADAYAFGSVRRADAQSEPIREAAASYDNAWFKTHRLLLVEIEASSGSYRHTMQSVERAPDGAVTVRYTRTEPQVFTCDMAYWIFCIELDATDFTASDPVTVLWDRD